MMLAYYVLKFRRLWVINR